MMREKTGRSGFEQNRVVHSKIYALFGDDFIPDVNLLQLRALELGGENRQGSVAESLYFVPRNFFRRDCSRSDNSEPVLPSFRCTSIGGVQR